MTFRIHGVLVTTLIFGMITACSAPATPPVLATNTILPSIAPSASLPPRTATDAATITPVPTIASTSTATLVPTPTDQTGCTNLADFVEDVTIPDNTNLQPGEAFSKTWRIRNKGTCTWNQRFLLVYLRGDQMSAPDSIELKETAPGADMDVSVNMVAPAKEGAFKGVYQFQAPDGKRFAMIDGNLWVKIVVGSGTPPSPTQPSNPRVISTPGSPSILLPSITPSSTQTTIPAQTKVSGACAYVENVNYENQTFALINAARALNSLPAFTLNSMLSSSATKHSIDMGCNNFLKHMGSDGSNVKSRVAAEGYSASSVQEGIYAQPPQYGGTPQSAVDWWLNDAIHRAILLNSTLTEIGVGYVSVPSSSLGGYFTIVVATP